MTSSATVTWMCWRGSHWLHQTSTWQRRPASPTRCLRLQFPPTSKNHVKILLHSGGASGRARAMFFYNYEFLASFNFHKCRELCVHESHQHCVGAILVFVRNDNFSQLQPFSTHQMLPGITHGCMQPLTTFFPSTFQNPEVAPVLHFINIPRH